MIGYAINIGEHAWYQRLAPAAVDFAQTRGVEVRVVDAAGDAPTQIEQLNRLLDDGARALAISPMDPTSLGEILDRCQAVGVPIVTESIGTGDPRVVAHLGVDEYAVGVRLGERVARDLPPRDRVGLLSVGFPPLAEAAERESGFLSGMRRIHSRMDVHLVQGGGTTDAATADVRELLGFDPEWRPDVVFGVDDEVLLGALAALSEVGAFPQLTATYGISPPRGPAIIEDGTLSWGAAMLPELHGQVLAALVLEAMAGRAVPADVRLEAAIVTNAGHPEGWDRFYRQADGDFHLVDYHARQLLPAGFTLLDGPEQ